MSGAVPCLSKDLTTTPCHPSNRLCKWEGATLCADRALDEGAKRKWEGATLCRGTQRQRTSLRECSAHIVAVAAATPQERAAAAVPALRRGADNEQWCCCQRGLQLYQFRAAWLRYWAAQWHMARDVGRRFRGCRAKRLYLHLKIPAPIYRAG